MGFIYDCFGVYGCLSVSMDVYGCICVSMEVYRCL